MRPIGRAGFLVILFLGWSVAAGALGHARPERARGGAPAAVVASGVAGQSGRAILLVDVEPREPWVGQPAVLRVRLVLGEDLAEEPSYTPPVTTGFWAEAPSRPESYFATWGGRRVLVTETRTRLYPLAPGVAHVGAAGADVVLQSATGAGRWEQGRASPPAMTLRSEPIDVRVRPLPQGAPAGFDGAVGSFSLVWGVDRVRSARDVPVGVWLDVRGAGNLPLVKPPELVCADGEVFAGEVEDSLPGPGGTGIGRRRFQWSVLARRTGRLTVVPPGFAWFDPRAGTYRTAAGRTFAVDVDPPVFSSGRTDLGMPAVFARDVPDPFARGMSPWVWGLAGLLAGAAAAMGRIRPPADPHRQERLRVGVWRNALRAPGGPAFWRAAEEAVEWLEQGGRAVGGVRNQIAGTRYGGGAADADDVRARLDGELAVALPAARRRRWAPVVAVALLGAAVLVLGANARPLGARGGASRLGAADRVARSGDVARARSAWLGMWQEGARAPSLAARLAWAEMTRGAPGPATVWLLRGEQCEARDPAIAWVSGQVREVGGLVGARPVRLPVRRAEWAVLALALGLGVGALWPRGVALVAAAGLMLAAGAEPLQDAWAAHVAQAVVARNVTLGHAGLELETGQVVQVLSREGNAARVRAGRDLEGRVPAGALMMVGTAR